MVNIDLATSSSPIRDKWEECRAPAGRTASSPTRTVVAAAGACSSRTPTERRKRRCSNARIAALSRTTSHSFGGLPMESASHWSRVCCSVRPRGTLVVSRSGEDLAFFTGYTGPAWTPDGRLLLRSDGLWMTNRELGDLQRIDGGQIAGAMGTPAPHPDGQRGRLLVCRRHPSDPSGRKRIRTPGRARRDRPSRLVTGRERAGVSWVALSADREVDFYDTIERQLYELPTDVFLAEENISSYPDGPLSWNAR